MLWLILPRSLIWLKAKVFPPTVWLKQQLNSKTVEERQAPVKGFSIGEIHLNVLNH